MPTETTSPADEMTAAAERMRADLEGVMDGPWYAEDGDDTWRLYGVLQRIPPSSSGRIPEQVMNGQILKAPKHGTPYAEYTPDPPTGRHIAIWHPGLVRLVAQLLDRAAEDARTYLVWETPARPRVDGPHQGKRTPCWFCYWCDNWYEDGGCECWTAALELARAYPTRKDPAP